jgi:hypothetical protein
LLHGCSFILVLVARSKAARITRGTLLIFVSLRTNESGTEFAFQCQPVMQTFVTRIKS